MLYGRPFDLEELILLIKIKIKMRECAVFGYLFIVCFYSYIEGEHRANIVFCRWDYPLIIGKVRLVKITLHLLLGICFGNVENQEEYGAHRINLWKS